MPMLSYVSVPVIDGNGRVLRYNRMPIGAEHVLGVSRPSTPPSVRV